ncbi:hypothetical protein H7J07_06120 [Mycobacterium koreense]|uniref:Uncharacterized protein n=1 Tax=Mycolicibacillus koreensis TaxID=1069220 RepID=A0A7I7SCH9_9MYCO|nr:hypothetical protein [Mycolicibacillus koreensis]MCV7247803.1 hypothetical protein [Mycolicibacillus koreensis]OSC34681.1 hypothetical protein B8W67_05385 [Mycolicibacillus koreensis]BBY54190.1 hypothetical protein MKOR_14410 [Mycolicibacillus koreensis]
MSAFKLLAVLICIPTLGVTTAEMAFLLADWAGNGGDATTLIYGLFPCLVLAALACWGLDWTTKRKDDPHSYSRRTD